jgi:LPPG:FO 2-phospho-L-lactate transferase
LSVGDHAGAAANFAAPKIAVAPIVGGKAIKGPAAKMMREMGYVTPVTIAAHYDDVLDGFVLDTKTPPPPIGVRMPALVTDTIMRNADDKGRLATAVLDFAVSLTPRLRQSAPQLRSPAAIG